MKIGLRNRAQWHALYQYQYVCAKSYIPGTRYQYYNSLCSRKDGVAIIFAQIFLVGGPIL